MRLLSLLMNAITSTIDVLITISITISEIVLL